MLRLLYFAQLKDQLNCSEEQLDWQPELSTIAELKQHLSQRDNQWQKAFSANILAAVNQTMAKESHSISDGDEVAFFPPVTGG